MRPARPARSRPRPAAEPEAVIRRFVRRLAKLPEQARASEPQPRPNTTSTEKQ